MHALASCRISKDHRPQAISASTEFVLKGRTKRIIAKNTVAVVIFACLGKRDGMGEGTCEFGGLVQVIEGLSSHEIDGEGRTESCR